MANRTCSIPSCVRTEQLRRGWCSAHYDRWRKTGDVHADVPLRIQFPAGVRVPCTAEGCDTSATRRGLCDKHSMRLRTTGRIELLSPEERLYNSINTNGPVPAYNPGLGKCWLWRGYLYLGYGTTTYPYQGSRVRRPAHRVVYELLIGPITLPQLDHLCRVPACVNPSHLEPVTARENLLRSFGPSGMNARKTHCPMGHKYTPENTYSRLAKNGHERKCRTCAMERMRRRYHCLRRIRDPAAPDQR